MFIKALKIKTYALNGFMNVASLALPRVVLLYLYALASSSLYESKFTELTTLITIIVTFQLFGSAGLSKASNRYYALFHNDKKNQNQYSLAILIINSITSLLFSLVFYFFCNWYFLQYINISLSNEVLMFSSIGVLFSSLVGTVRGFFYAAEKVKWIFISTVISSVALLGLYNILVNLEFSNALIYSYITSVIIECVVLFMVFKLTLKIEINSTIDVNVFKKIISFSVPALLSSVLVMPVNMILIALISRYGTLMDISLYNIAIQWRNIIVFIPNAFSALALSVMARRLNDIDAMKKKFHQHLLIVSLIGISCLVLLIALQDYISMYYGSGNVDLTVFETSFLLSLLIGALMSVNSVIGQYIAAQGRMIKGLVLNFVWFVTVIIGAISLLDNLLSRFSAVNLVLSSMLISYAVHTAIQYYYFVIKK
ncbi:oligosaccharide flippase family protein [Vibrio fluvialis]|nr:oligosaccharide flippase family protein [Vibrio fluvialis]